RTNTPLQALALLNDPTYVEAGRKLAERAIATGPGQSERLTFLWKTVLAREPNADESKLMIDVLRSAAERFRKEPAAAEKLIKVGRSPRDAKLDPIELASWAVVSSVLLNLDEAISKP